METTNILICGDRLWKDRELVRTVLEPLKEEYSRVRIIHGNCEGADKIAGKIGKSLGYHVRKFRADWERYGNAAGPIRNREMITSQKITLVFAFHENISESRGTKNMINQAIKKKIPVLLIDADGEIEEICEKIR